MTIYADPTEIRKGSRLRRLPKKFVDRLIPLPGLETFTGSDFMITAMETPKLSDLGKKPQQYKARSHFSHGACLIQRKSGGDFSSSIGDLKDIQTRMLAVAPPGAVRLLITSLDITDDGFVSSGGHTSTLTYNAMVRALTFWEARGGNATLLDSDEQIPEWFDLIEEVVSEIRLHPTRYVTHAKASQQLQRERQNWITTGQAFPPGIGRTKREEIARSIRPRLKSPSQSKSTPSLIEALAWAADPVTAKKTRGIGPKLCKSIREWLGLKGHERIVYPKWGKITVLLPADTRLPLIKDQWQRLPTGEIEAVFDPEQAEICLSILNIEEKHDEPNREKK